MSDWDIVRMGDVVEFLDSRRVPLSSVDRAGRQGEYPYYGASGVIDHIDDYLFDGRFLLVAEDGENLNSRKLPIAFFASGRFWVNNHAHIIRGKEGVADDDFLHQWFAQADIAGYITGAAQPKLSQASMRRIELELPHFSTQKKIASILSAFDDLIENNNRRIKILEEMAQRIYREWFVEFRYPGHEQVPMVDSELGKIPEGWQVHPTSDAIDIDPRLRVDATIQRPFVPMTSLSETSMHIDPIEQRATSTGSKFQNGDTLFARITPCLENGKTGFVQFLSESAIASGSTEFIVLRERMVPRSYVYLLARSDRFRDHALSSMSGATGRQRVTRSCFDSLLLPVSPPALNDLFEQTVGPLFTLSYDLRQMNGVLRKCRQLLLPRLISGDINVEHLDIPVDKAAA